jgi:hypothetical protein
MTSTRLFLWLGAFALFLGACDRSEPENTIHLTGQITDLLTGSPIRGMNVYSCPGTAFGNATVTISTKILKTTTDDCGRYSITIPGNEQHYSVHGSSGNSPVILFSEEGYGEFIFRPSEAGDFSHSFQRPFLDSVRWFFNESGNLLTLEVRRNSVFSVAYHEGDQYPDIIVPSGDVLTGHSSADPNIIEFENFSGVPADTWISHSVQIEAGASTTIMVNATGNGRSDGEVRFDIPGTDRSQEYNYVLPNRNPLCN